MKREIRAGTITGPAGVGAVIDVGSESFIIPGIGVWKQNGLRVMQLARLSNRLRKVLKGPSLENPFLPVKRFPRAMFCEKCRRMTSWRAEMEVEGREPACPQGGCNGKLVPMRFVAACEDGHLDDVNWSRWAHSGSASAENCRSYDRLRFTVDEKAGTGGLGSLLVSCDVCKSGRSLADLVSKESARHVFGKCTGRHPWIYGHAEQCELHAEILQRGATNLHYPVSVSALDIPTDVLEKPVEEYAEQVTAHRNYAKLVKLNADTEGANQSFLEVIADQIATDVGCTVDVVLAVVGSDAKNESKAEAPGGPPGIEQADLLVEEWKTMACALKEGSIIGANFRALSEPLGRSVPEWARQVVAGVLLVERLREVRAYLGFQRVRPDATGRKVAPDTGGVENWIPATEVYGEGILLSFDFERLDAWVRALPASEIVALQRLEDKRVSEQFWFLPKVDPAFVALHALSHLLLRRITFECGYSSSSLRERIYFDAAQRYAGVMIYTADGDSEGSLGGLVRQGRADRLAQTLYEAVEQGRWCSADPVCAETAGQGLGGFNRASCHACQLVAETSCGHANTMLDRRLLLDEEFGLVPFLEKSR
jgi:hypothetical protein